VEDTIDLGEGIVACIEKMGHAVDWAQDGESADKLLQDTAYELVVLDLGLPELDGVGVLRNLRRRRGVIPVLVVTARSEIDDRVHVLDEGADDYLTKPFDFRELEARVRALLRRKTGDRTNLLACEGVALDRAARTATVSGKPVPLTRRELSLLEVLLANQSKILSKSQILDQIFDYSAEPTENAIEVIVTRLRPKLAGSGAEIRTHRGLGYQIGPS
jgi:two-component system response regulator TctD